MGFSLKKLAKIGGIVAAPFTGGTSLALTAAVVASENAKKQQEAAEAAERAAQAAASAERTRLEATMAQQRSVSPLAQFSANPYAATRAASVDTSFLASPILIGGVVIIVAMFFFKKG